MTAADARAVVGVDVGGTTIKGGVVGPGEPVPRRRLACPRGAGRPDAVVEAVLATVDGLLEDAARAHRHVDTIGLAVPGVVDERAGVARASAAIGWRDVPLRALVEERTGCRVALGHDVRAATLVEAVFGAGRGHRNVLLVAIGTGLSAAQVVDGRAVAGESWRAGEIGQLPSSGLGDGGGTSEARLEQLVSGEGMARRLDHRLGRPVGTSAASELFTPTRAGTATCAGPTAVRDEALDLLARALAAVVTVLDPGVVVIGGGVSRAGDALLDPLHRRLVVALGWREQPPLVAAYFGDDAGWIGAGLLAWRASGLSEAGFVAGVRR